jgi:hypothetical protein
VLGAPEGVIGKRVKCTKCGHVFTAESADRAPAAPMPSGPPPLPKTNRQSQERVDDEPPTRSDRASSRRDPSEFRRDWDRDRYDDDERSRSRSGRGPAKKKSPVLLYVLLGLGALFVLCAGGGGVVIYFALSEGTPRDYTVAEGCVSAQFPGTPKRDVKPDGRIQYELEFWRSAYIVLLEPLDRELLGRAVLTENEIQLLMQAVQRNVASGPGLTVLKKNQISYQGHSGIEIEATDAKGNSVICRIFFTSRYVIVVGFGSRGQLDRAKATRFLDSVKILDPKPDNLK